RSSGVGRAGCAVGRQLVDPGGGRGRAKVDVPATAGGCGVEAPFPRPRALRGHPPLLFEPAGIVPADGLLAPVVAATEDVVVVHRPILRVRLRASRGPGKVATKMRTNGVQRRGPVMVGSIRDRGAIPQEGTPEGREGKLAGRVIPCPVSDPATPPSPDPRSLVVRLF